MNESLTHRHGRWAHTHPSRGRHRHLGLALRASVDIDEGNHQEPGHEDRPDHAHRHNHGEGDGHTHGLVADSIKRSRDGMRTVALSLVVLGVTAILQLCVYIASGSVALLADLIHNFGDALTAIPLAIAFTMRSRLAERRAGLAVVAAIFISACIAAAEAVNRLVHRTSPGHLAALAGAGLIGFAGNAVAARIRTRAGHRLDSPALVADGDHARADAYVSLGVVAAAAAVALGVPIADPIIGLAITVVIGRITWQSWRTVSNDSADTP